MRKDGPSLMHSARRVFRRASSPRHLRLHTSRRPISDVASTGTCATAPCRSPSWATRVPDGSTERRPGKLRCLSSVPHGHPTRGREARGRTDQTEPGKEVTPWHTWCTAPAASNANGIITGGTLASSAGPPTAARPAGTPAAAAVRADMPGRYPGREHTPGPGFRMSPPRQPADCCAVTRSARCWQCRCGGPAAPADGRPGGSQHCGWWGSGWLRSCSCDSGNRPRPRSSLGSSRCPTHRLRSCSRLSNCPGWGRPRVPASLHAPAFGESAEAAGGPNVTRLVATLPASPLISAWQQACSGTLTTFRCG